LVSEFRLTAGCVLMDLASPAVSGTSVYASGLSTQVRGFKPGRSRQDFSGRKKSSAHLPSEGN